VLDALMFGCTPSFTFVTFATPFTPRANCFAELRTDPSPKTMLRRVRRQRRRNRVPFANAETGARRDQIFFCVRILSSS
jgi:hypothetical protein